jgi:hypothetical protein
MAKKKKTIEEEKKTLGENRITAGWKTIMP